MDKIYLLIGRTGEYEDRYEWYVLAFSKKEPADKLCNKLNDWCTENNCHLDRTGYMDDNLKCPYDDKFSLDYTGTRYYIEEIKYEI